MGCGSSAPSNDTAGNGANVVSKGAKKWNFGEVKEVSDAIVSGMDTNTVLVDCRSPDEVAESGTIPGAIVVPFDEMGEALKLSPEEFRVKYNADKFTKDNIIVVFCLRGMRSEKAMPILEAAGYTRVENYEGGWIDWAEKRRKHGVDARRAA